MSPAPGAVGERANDLVASPPEQLRSIQPVTGSLVGDRDIVAPLVPLSASDLLVNARGEPALAHALAREIPSADAIDLLCAFVRWHGLRLLEGELRAHCSAKKRLRVITTVFTGSAERRALDRLVSLGAEVKVSYGSSNLSKAALVDGVEWNVRLSQVGSPDILEKFDATFNTCWESPEYEAYDPARDAARFDRAVAPEQGDTLDAPLLFLDLVPYPHQIEMLEKLAVERDRHRRFKNLVVAATGTGKTIVAALHRQEILKQSLYAFRTVLPDANFGEPYVDGHRPDEWQHVFASIQSLAQVDLDRLDPSAFDMVIVDEFHHAAAPTYRKLLDHLAPRILLGLTATPERTASQCRIRLRSRYRYDSAASDGRVRLAIGAGIKSRMLDFVGGSPVR